MLKVNEVAFFCYPVTDVVRARSFYEDILGLAPGLIHQSPDMSWVEYEIGSATLAVGTASNWKPSNEGGNVALEVENFETSIAYLREKHVIFSMEPIETPVCHMAIICDPDGSRIIIHKRKPGHS